MSVFYYVVCHSCKMISDTDYFPQDAVESLEHYWLSGSHKGHSVEVIADTYLDEEDQNLWDKVSEYTKV